MEIPHRILRARAENIEPALRERTPRQQERHLRILKIALDLFANFGFAATTFTGLAAALKMGTGTLRQHFTDRDSLLHELLRLHLAEIATALIAIPPGAPNRAKTMRRAYLAATRTEDNASTQAHLLLLRERHNLPEDLRAEIEQSRAIIARNLSPSHPEQMLDLLDTASLDAETIASLAVNFAPPEEAAARQPETPKHLAPAPLSRPRVAGMPDPCLLTATSLATQSQAPPRSNGAAHG